MSILSQFARAFPPPNYLSMPGAGIDIGESSVKVVTFKTHTGGCLLGGSAQAELAEGVVVGGDIEKPDVLVETLRSFRLRERIHFAHAALPERKAYVYQILVPHSEKKDLHSAVEFSLEGNVPIAPADVEFDYEVSRTISSGTIVSVTAIARRVVESYQDVFQRAGITLRSLEIESQALKRTLWGEENKERTIMSVDFGRKTTRVAIFDSGTVAFTATLDVGGDALTSAVMKRFAISEEEAEKMKNEKGFLEGNTNRDLYEALATTASVLKDEIGRHVGYWNELSVGENSVPRRSVERIVLVGGNANVKGIAEHLSRVLGMSVCVGDVWNGVIDLDTYIPTMDRRNSFEYATTIGLAARSCNPRLW